MNEDNKMKKTERKAEDRWLLRNASWSQVLEVFGFKPTKIWVCRITNSKLLQHLSPASFVWLNADWGAKNKKKH